MEREEKTVRVGEVEQVDCFLVIKVSRDGERERGGEGEMEMKIDEVCGLLFVALPLLLVPGVDDLAFR